MSHRVCSVELSSRFPVCVLLGQHALRYIPSLRALVSLHVVWNGVLNQGWMETPPASGVCVVSHLRSPFDIRTDGLIDVRRH